MMAKKEEAQQKPTTMTYGELKPGQRYKLPGDDSDTEYVKSRDMVMIDRLHASADGVVVFPVDE